ncbi:MAG: hypothetical protein RIR37_141 [Verrucomicrobiota bacterium]
MIVFPVCLRVFDQNLYAGLYTLLNLTAPSPHVFSDVIKKLCLKPYSLHRNARCKNCYQC